MSDTDTCTRCQQAKVNYVPDQHRLCRACYVDWYVPLSFVLRRDLPAWVEPTLRGSETLEPLLRFWDRDRMPHVTVYVFSRAETQTVAWQFRWWRDAMEAKVLPDYGVRGWADYYRGQIVLLVDETETPDSLRWLLFHELGHIATAHVPMIDRAWDEKNKRAGRTTYNWLDDDAHESDAEEQFVNELATLYAGASYDRHWWRRRVFAAQRGTLAEAQPVPAPAPEAATVLPPAVEEINHGAATTIRLEAVAAP